MAERKTVLGSNLEKLTVIPAINLPGFLKEQEPDEQGIISVSDLVIDEGTAYVFNETLQRHSGLKQVCFSNCIFLQGIRLDVSLPGLSVSFNKCRSPLVHLRGIRVGYDACLVSECYFGRFCFEGKIRRLHLRATVGEYDRVAPNRLRLEDVLLSGEVQELCLDVPIKELTLYLGNKTRPQLMSNFSVMNRIKTSSLDWAEYLSLTCPTTPIYMIPMVDETSQKRSILQQIAMRRHRAAPRK